MFTPLETLRLELRQLKPADAEAIFAYRSDPGIAKYQSWGDSSLAEIRAFIADLADKNPDTPGSWYQIGIVLRETGELIGDCGIHVLAAEPRQVEIGITLATSFHGRGLAIESLHALFDYLFVTLGKHRVIGSTDPLNAASISMMRRVGMRQEARCIESLWFKGEWVDDLIFAMLAREWQSRHPTVGDRRRSS